VTTLLLPEVEVLVGDAVTPLWCELGLGSPIHAGVFDGLTLSAWPASLDDPSPYGGLVVHRLAPPPSEDSGPEWLASWVSAQDGRPIVYATLGTVSGGNLTVLRAILDGLAGEDVAVLMTVGDAGDPEAFGDVPGNARVERYVPQEVVLAHCAAVVSHAGAGTTLGALAYGLPQVWLPQGADQFINAARCEAAVLGRRLMPAAATAEVVRSALRAVLDNTVYGDNAVGSR
jgi:MGT family glycosyltransferase